VCWKQVCWQSVDGAGLRRLVVNCKGARRQDREKLCRGHALNAGVILCLHARAELGKDAVPNRTTEQLAVDCSWRQHPLCAGGTLRLHLCGPEGGKMTHLVPPRSDISPHLLPDQSVPSVIEPSHQSLQLWQRLPLHGRRQRIRHSDRLRP
jgi:hypothetical protein